MLVLSREIGERIMIGPNIELTILQVRGQRVQVGVTAPSDVQIKREELIGTETAHHGDEATREE